jgi:HD-like signal output (HDOD) protein
MPNEKSLSRRQLEEHMILLQRMLEQRFDFMRGRAKRVHTVCLTLSGSLKLSLPQTYAMNLASQIHDVGMLGIPEGLLMAQRKLTPAELVLVRAHTKLGAWLASRLFQEIPELAEAIMFHHERPDGTGFCGLKGDAIPLLSGIIAMGEAVDAMTSNRPHRPPLPQDRILSTIQQNAGTQFVKPVVDVFLKVHSDVFSQLGLPDGAKASNKPAEPAPSAGVAVCSNSNSSETKLPDNQKTHKPLQALLTREVCLQRVDDAVSGKAFSPVMSRVIGMAASAVTSLDELTGVISADPALSSRVMRAANSSAYSGNHKIVSNLKDAVRKIGCSTVRNIAMTFGVAELVPATQKDFDPIRYWQHSLAVAMLCERWTAADPANSGLAYLAGLCHDLGELLFHTSFAAEYRQVLAAQAQMDASLNKIEREMLGATKSELIRLLSQKIGLPDAVSVPIEQFHRLSAQGKEEGLPLILRMADAYANGLLLASDTTSQVFAFEKTACRAIIGSAESATEDQAKFREEIRMLTIALANLTPSDEAQAITPLLPRRETPIWVATDQVMAAVNPIANAVAALAEATLQQRLPTEGDLPNHNGLIVVCRDAGQSGLGRTALDTWGSRPTAFPIWLITNERLRAEQKIPNSQIKISGPGASLENLAAFIAKCTEQALRAAA